MVRKPALLVLIGVTLFGCLGGLIAVFVRPPRFQADAIVIVYEMPHDQRELIGPDEAQQIDGFYRAGALQPKVVQHVLSQFPGMTPAQLRAAIGVSVIAYTPLTRITATATSPQRAVDLANAVAVSWTSLADALNETAWTTTVDTLKSHEQELNNQIATTQQAIANARAAGTSVDSLQAQLNTQLQQLSKTDDALINLDKARLDLIGNASVATPADVANVTRTPDPIKLTAEGGAGGLALGLLFVLWMLRRQRLSRPADSAPSSGNEKNVRPAFVGASVGEANDAR